MNTNALSISAIRCVGNTEICIWCLKVLESQPRLCPTLYTVQTARVTQAVESRTGCACCYLKVKGTCVRMLAHMHARRVRETIEEQVEGVLVARRV